jgi:membrane-associated phospholipid phosphatase
MKKIIEKHKSLWKERSFQISIGWGLVFWAVTLSLNHYAESYLSRTVGRAVNDMVLDNTRTYDVDGILTYGVLIFVLFLVAVVVRNPEKIPFTMKSLALFYLVRSIFITLTHLGPNPTRLPVDPATFMSSYLTGNDFFFSGHTGMPFLMALVFWEDKIVRYVCLAASVVFGTAVLLGHLHYSIDVFSAFFIAFGIFHIAKAFFTKDYGIFSQWS